MIAVLGELSTHLARESSPPLPPPASAAAPAAVAATLPLQRRRCNSIATRLRRPATACTPEADLLLLWFPCFAVAQEVSGMGTYEQLGTIIDSLPLPF